MKYYYDLHIHTALSPCADNDMTPSNIVNMAKLCRLDIIAVTDHNSVRNAGAVMKAALRECGPLVIPGMELTTSEDIHIVVLFESLSDAEKFNETVDESRLKIKNRISVFGQQQILDEEDNVVNEEENLLIAATEISVDDVVALAERYNGVAFPAHIDRQGNGILAILGDISPHLGFRTVEVSSKAPASEIRAYEEKGYLVLSNSDSHALGVMNEESVNFLELESLSAKNIIEAIRHGKTVVNN